MQSMNKKIIGYKRIGFDIMQQELSIQDLKK